MFVFSGKILFYSVINIFVNMSWIFGVNNQQTIPKDFEQMVSASGGGGGKK